MKLASRIRWCLVSLVLVLAVPAAAQQQSGKTGKKAPKAEKPDSLKDTTLAKFYESEDPMDVTLTFNIKRVKGDKGDDAPWRDALLSYTPPGSSAPLNMALQLKTHGIWRLKNCDFPPLRLNFGKESKGTIFARVDKPKLTSYCRNDDGYEQYVLQELQAYRIYQKVSPYSHAVRALRVTYVDSVTGKPVATRYGFLQEDPDKLADRLRGRIIKATGAGPADLDPYQATVFGLFQYLIGNTDFSIAALHNVEIFTRPLEDGAIPIARDFDFSGIVNTRYATPNDKLGIRKVRDRLYRGYCFPDSNFTKAIALFNAKKDAIYALYHDKIGQLLKPDIVKETTEYIDDFYKTINNPRDAKRQLMEACLGRR
jgi:hypothetical protein